MFDLIHVCKSDNSQSSSSSFQDSTFLIFIFGCVIEFVMLYKQLFTFKAAMTNDTNRVESQV